jgi:hypothetical protein
MDDHAEGFTIVVDLDGRIRRVVSWLPGLTTELAAFQQLDLWPPGNVRHSVQIIL